MKITAIYGKSFKAYKMELSPLERDIQLGVICVNMVDFGSSD